MKHQVGDVKDKAKPVTRRSVPVKRIERLCWIRRYGPSLRDRNSARAELRKLAIKHGRFIIDEIWERTDETGATA